MTSPESIDLSVVVPAFNEEKRLAATLEKIVTHLASKAITHEILVVDDGSSDSTAHVAESFSKRHVQTLVLDRHRGKGAALKLGVLATRGKRVLLTDADLSTPIEELEHLESRLAEAPLVLGSRALPDSRIIRHQALHREWMGKTFNRILRLSGIRGIADTQCGFKLLDGDVARNLFARLVTSGFAFDVELIWLAQRTGLGIIEVGIEWENSPDSRVGLIVDPPRMLLEILVFHWRHRGLRQI
jgi:dolichyl-phosphate beta-glucosyltransferase